MGRNCRRSTARLALGLILGWGIVLTRTAGAQAPAGTPSPTRLNDPVTIEAFNGRAVATVTPYGGQDGITLTWTIKFGDTTIIRDSPIGLELQSGKVFSKNLKVHTVRRGEQDETYDYRFGKRSRVRNHYKEAYILLDDPDGIRFEVIVYGYDDGFAMKMAIPRQEGLEEVAITRELTSFTFPADYRFWALTPENMNTSNEARYTSGPLTSLAGGALVSLPVLIQAGDNAWANLSEAQLVNYAGSYYRPQGGTTGSLTLETRLAPWPPNNPVLVRTQTPMETPWRVVMLGDHPGRLIESDMIINLNPAPAMDTSWVKPGLCGWDWWNGPYLADADFPVGMNNKTFERFIDFCSAQKIPYMVVDAGWYGDHKDTTADITKSIPEMDIPHLVQYGRERNVDLMLWLNWENVRRQREAAFALYEQWGIKGVKIDYMNREDQEMVNFLIDTVKVAAQHKLGVDYHGAYKPTGERRTWPNLLTREGVQGLEYVKWSADTDPAHDCVLPFTRMLVGPMDYTPGGFNNVPPARFEIRNINPLVMGTRAHQVALFVIYESPLQMLVDSPSNYEGQPGLRFISSCPTVWDETLFLQGEIGEYCMLARKKDGAWYLGAITDFSARTLKAPLTFLDEGITYSAFINEDGPSAEAEPKDLVERETTVRKGDTLEINMAPGGGYAVRLAPAVDGGATSTPAP